MAKITEKEINELKLELGKLPADKKDYLLARLLLVVDRLGGIVKDMAGREENKKLAEKTQKEIEQAISLGPTWLNYTFKSKEKK